jgi:hypothetical protein
MDKLNRDQLVCLVVQYEKEYDKTDVIPMIKEANVTVGDEFVYLTWLETGATDCFRRVFVTGIYGEAVEILKLVEIGD